jgi:hypothetical protein
MRKVSSIEDPCDEEELRDWSINNSPPAILTYPGTRAEKRV